MTDELVIGLDLSTTAAKAVAWSPAGRPAATGRAAVPSSHPAPGGAEQEAEDWWRAAAEALRACAREAGTARIAALGITVQRETFCLLDADGHPLRPAILWYDARGAPYLPALAAELGAEAYHRATGKQLDATAALAKLRWLRLNEAPVLERAALVADVLAYLSLRLTGQAATTWAGADTTGLVDFAGRAWHAAHLRAAGLCAERMPRLVGPGEALGALSPAAAATTGLPAGVPVVAGGGDGHVFALGAGRGRPRTATITLGTSAVLALPATRPHLGPAFRTLLGCGPEPYLLESVIQSGSATVRWLEETFLPPEAAATPAATEAALAALPPGSDGLLVLPYWRGARVPVNDPDARGVTAGWSDRHTHHHFRRAILEGIALSLGHLLDRLVEACGQPVEAVILGGGGARSDAWCRILAAALDRPCRRPATVEAASLGAALLARAHTAGGLAEVLAATTVPEEAFEPEPEAAALYARLRELQEDLYRQTRRLVGRLGRLAGGPR